MKTLVGTGYSPNVTKLDRGAFNGSGRVDKTTGSEGSAISGRPRLGPIRTTPIPFRLVAGVPLNVLQANPHRKGLLIQNLDPVTNLNVSFGIVADASSFALPPNSVMLLDFITPTDAVWVFATLAVSGVVYDFSPITG